MIYLLTYLIVFVLVFIYHDKFAEPRPDKIMIAIMWPSMLLWLIVFRLGRIIKWFYKLAEHIILETWRYIYEAWRSSKYAQRFANIL